MRSNLISISYKHFHNNEYCITKETQLTRDILSEMFCAAVFQKVSKFYNLQQGSKKYFNTNSMIVFSVHSESTAFSTFWYNLTQIDYFFLIILQNTKKHEQVFTHCCNFIKNAVKTKQKKTKKHSDAWNWVQMLPFTTLDVSTAWLKLTSGK